MLSVLIAHVALLTVVQRQCADRVNMRHAGSICGVSCKPLSSGNASVEASQQNRNLFFVDSVYELAVKTDLQSQSNEATVQCGIIIRQHLQSLIVGMQCDVNSASIDLCEKH